MMGQVMIKVGDNISCHAQAPKEIISLCKMTPFTYLMFLLVLLDGMHPAASKC